MADSLALAARETNLADQAAPKTNRLAFDAETSNLRWFYHTFRTTANYYESCLLRDKLLALEKTKEQSPRKVTEAKQLYAQWRKVLLDERTNAIAAIPVMTSDMRLDFYYGFGGSVAPGKVHGADMIRKKIEILETEIDQVLPLLAKRCGFVPGLSDVENL
ncbi:MAG: hypothetical protein NT154_47195, partial [Verrucomicrobia bacterium]|nr:hypothetical protein [Verrucomicrobiota bacterium]